MINNKKVKLKWLEKKPEHPAGITWGVPWKQGYLDRNESLNLIGKNEESIPMQSWPAAYWPDGSVKWTTHAASIDKIASENYFITKIKTALSKSKIIVNKKNNAIEINTGKLNCKFKNNGSSILDEIKKDGRIICTGGKLICIIEENKNDMGVKITREESFISEISNIVVEQKGPIRAVIKIEGKHKSSINSRKLLPFILRFYFYVNIDSIKIIHTIIYDVDEHKDFIKGLGIKFDIPVSGELYNRQIRLSGDKGLFCENSQFLSKYFKNYEELYPCQVAGNILHEQKNENGETVDMVQDMAIWDSFKLVQDSSDHYVIRKRTKTDCSWIETAHGNRSDGFAYIGNDAGGFATVVRNFWQKYPSSIEINNFSHDTADFKVWFWTPDVSSMDLRHYDTETHTVSSYEGATEFRNTPYGIANTSEINIFYFGRVPSNEELLNCKNITQSPPILSCMPEYYHEAKVFGIWSLPDKNIPAKARLEDKLDMLIKFYKNEIEQRRWYGFWNFGDIMHTYDSTRHTWKYDVGGYAWQNTELVPNMWLWYSFLRTGRLDVFRFAEAMARHTSEVDIYHIGEYAGLGSRHNVMHWGCGCKEPRISMAGLHRFYYYLTGDERIGDIMNEVKDSDHATLNLDPMRSYFPKDEFPTHVRSGPDWAAFTSNWLTRGERYEDIFYRDKIIKGINDLKKMPFRLLSGTTFGYDPETGALYFMGNENYGYHMAICFGAAEIWMELAELLKDQEWKDMLSEFGEFYNLSNDEKLKRTKGELKGKDWNWPMFSASLAAYASVNMNDKKLALKAWQLLLDKKINNNVTREPFKTDYIDDPGIIKPINEIPGISTNSVSMWSLRVIQNLELIGNYLEEAFFKMK